MCVLIFGLRGVESVAETGRFHCPRCDQEMTYSNYLIRRWFTLFFLPVIPLDKLGSYISCWRCNTAYTHEVLNAFPAEQEAALRKTIRESYRRLLVGIVLTDGRIDPAEADFALKAAQGILGDSYTRSWFDRDVARFKDDDLLASMRSVANITDDSSKEFFVIIATQLSAVDGELHKDEVSLVFDVANALGIQNERAAELMQTALKPPPNTLTA